VIHPLSQKRSRRSETSWSPKNIVVYPLVSCYIPEPPLTYVPEF
jgi:hypothetical protein